MALKDQPSDVTDVAVKPAGTGGENLADLVREADMLDAAPQVAAQAGQLAEFDAQQATVETELYVTLQGIRDMVMPLLQVVMEPQRAAMIEGVWGDDVLKRQATAGARVCIIHGWDVGELGGKYAPYIALGGAFLGPVIVTKKILEIPAAKPEQASVAPANGQQQ